MLLVRRDNSLPGNPATHIVMQHRADTGNFWCIPGGARDRGETMRQTAFREAREEVSLPRNCEQGPNPLIRVRSEATLTDHGAWKYLTVIADVLGNFMPRRPPGDTESLWVGWVPIDQVGERSAGYWPLMPAFWDVWPEAKAIVESMNQPVPAPVPPTVPPPVLSSGPAPGPAPIDEPTLAETGEPVPPLGGSTATTSSGNAPVSDPVTYLRGDEDEDIGAERKGLAALQNLCFWFIPAEP